MEINNKTEIFEPAVVSEVTVEAPKTATPETAPKTAPIKETAPAPVHIHHGVVGAGIMVGGIVAALVSPVKPVTRLVIGASAFALGLALVWDDVQAHLEGGCGFDTWLNFTPCPEKVTVVRKKDVGAMVSVPK